MRIGRVFEDEAVDALEALRFVEARARSTAWGHELAVIPRSSGARARGRGGELHDVLRDEPYPTISFDFAIA